MRTILQRAFCRVADQINNTLLVHRHFGCWEEIVGIRYKSERQRMIWLNWLFRATDHKIYRMEYCEIQGKKLNNIINYQYNLDSLFNNMLAQIKSATKFRLSLHKNKKLLPCLYATYVEFVD